MKKKLTKYLAVLCMFACVFSLTACGEDAKKVTFSDDTEKVLTSELKTQNMDMTVEEYAQQSVESMVTQIEMNAINIERDELQAYYDDDPDTYEYVVSYLEATDGLGEYLDNSYNYTFEMDDTSITMTGMLDFEELDVKFNYHYDYAASEMSLTFERELTLGEILQKAGMNTLLGMGTVFLVLILISCIIACFGLINGNGKAKTAPAAPATPVAPATPAAPVAQAQTPSSDEEMAIVLAMAMALAEEENAGSDDYVVRSVKRSKNSKWRRA